MGAAPSILGGFACSECNHTFMPQTQEELAALVVRCPRCGGRAESRASRIGPPPVLVTPTGLIMTEDTFRQMLLSQLSLPANRADVAVETMIAALRRSGLYTDVPPPIPRVRNTPGANRCGVACALPASFFLR